MPQRRPTEYEFTTAKLARDEAREFIETLYPGARVVFGMGTFDGEVSATATIVGDTDPYPRDEITDCLGQLGVRNITD